MIKCIPVPAQNVTVKSMKMAQYAGGYVLTLARKCPIGIGIKCTDVNNGVFSAISLHESCKPEGVSLKPFNLVMTLHIIHDNIGSL